MLFLSPQNGGFYFAKIRGFKVTDYTWLQYWYLGSLIPLGGDHRIAPMAGCIHSWRFEENPDLALGLVYSYGPWSFFVWCGQIFSGSPLLTAGFEFDLPTKI